MTTLKFLRVSGPGTSHRYRAVLAVVDGHLVRWHPSQGWRCRCPDPYCRHADLVADLLDDAVTAPTEPTRGDKP